MAEAAKVRPQQATPVKSDGPRLTGLKKRQQIELAGRYMFIAVAIAAIAISFCVATGQYLFSKWDYNNKILNAKSTANDTLSRNITNANELKKEVDALLANVALGSVRTDANDTTTKSILDALPTSFDAAALATSLQQAILNRSGVNIESITVPAESGDSQVLPPTPQEIKINFVVTGSYDKVQTLIHDIERTIRPIKITSLVLTGNDTNLRVSIEAITYYQPSKSVGAAKEVIR